MLCFAGGVGERGSRGPKQSGGEPFPSGVRASPSVSHVFLSFLSVEFADMSFERRSVLWGIMLCASLIDPGLRADTVYLKNGAWIDGTVRARDEQIVEVQIGEVGKIEIKVEDIYEIEKNNRTGAERVPSGMENSAALAHLTREGKKKQALEQAEESKGGAGGTAGGREPGSLGDTEDESPVSPELEARIKQLVADLQRHVV